MNGFVNEFKLPAEVIQGFAPSLLAGLAVQPLLAGCKEPYLQLDRFVLPDECQLLLAALSQQNWAPVGLNGRLKDYIPERSAIGSWRLSTYSEALAAILWQRLKSVFPAKRVMAKATPTDWDGHRTWRPVGINPLMRFIKYEPCGALIPHYDAPYIWDDNCRTLMSFVLYLSESEKEAGATRFLFDKQAALPLEQRDYADWKHFAFPADVKQAILPKMGRAIVFDHRLLHDSATLLPTDNDKIILRTDVMFEKC